VNPGVLFIARLDINIALLARAKTIIFDRRYVAGSNPFLLKKPW